MSSFQTTLLPFSSWRLDSMRGSLFCQTSLSLLKKIADTKNLRLGKSIHANLIVSHQCDLIKSNYLINLYAKCGNLSAARHVFDFMPKRNVVSIGSLIAGYFHNGCPSEVLSVFKMIGFGLLDDKPNEFIFSTVLASCSEMLALDAGQQCHAYVLKSGLLFHSYIRNALLHMYSKCSGLEDALGVFQSVTGCDIFSFNSMINVLLEHERLFEAVDILRSMVGKTSQWDHITYVAVLGLSANSKDVTLGRQVHCQIIKRGFMVNVYIGSSTVDMYGKCGDASSALSAFHVLSCRNAISWTAVMDACTKNGCFEETLKLFTEMQVDDVWPNELSYAVVLNACGLLSAMSTGNSLNAHAEKSGYKAYTTVGNALIIMYSKGGSIEDAQRVFVDLTEKDIISWNCVIASYSHHGLGREALETFHCMLEEGIVPTYVTFISVLSACGHLGMVHEGYYYINHFMRSLGINPGVEHHTCIVGLLCRAGLLYEADRYMRTTNSEWDIVTWRTLLSACQVHRKFGLGRKVADYILQLYPYDVGTCILLSNIYAKAKRWDGVVKIRKLLRDRCIKKEPGVSWMQVRSETHVFASEDTMHPLITNIHEKLAELIEKIKALGYSPNLASVMHDVEDEQKEKYLSFHSEKLAIAFGLISMPSEATIHVMKNLRMCDDCHIAIKLISGVTNRKIVVRDVNRFHCFLNGLCSCNDYW